LDFPLWIREGFRTYKRRGLDGAIQLMKALEKEVLRNDPSSTARHAELNFILWYGQAIIDKLSAEIRDTFLPINDARCFFLEDKLVIEFRSLIHVKVGNESIFHSRMRPTINHNSNELTIAFSKHAIDQISSRLNPRWRKSYASLGDIFAWFDQCAYFERAMLLNGQPAFSFFEKCARPPYVQYRYVEKVLGEENLPVGKQAYYRAGYCPYTPIRGFAKARTLLLPGFAKTPEFSLLRTSGLPAHEVLRLESIATRDAQANAIPDEKSFETCLFFHQHGIPQVIVSEVDFYNYFPNRNWKLLRIK
jgi:hypothetical protein